MDTAGDAVACGDEKLREGVALIDRGILNISLGRLINDVSDNEALNGLILRNAATAVVACDIVDVATTVLGPTRVSSLLGH